MFSTPSPTPVRKSPYVVSTEEAIEEIRAGRMIILMDDEDRENEGDLYMAAEKVTPEAINFMATYGRGLICLPMAEEMIDTLGLPMMVTKNTAPLGTAFTVSIDARHGITHGIAAEDRATPVQRRGPDLECLLLSVRDGQQCRNHRHLLGPGAPGHQQLLSITGCRLSGKTEAGQSTPRCIGDIASSIGSAWGLTGIVGWINLYHPADADAINC